MKEEQKQEEQKKEILVVTSDFCWGKGPTLAEAMKKAYVKIDTKQVFAYIGKDLKCHASGSVTGSEIADLGDIAILSIFDRSDIINATQTILDDLKGHDNLCCDLEDIKDDIYAEEEEQGEREKAKEDLGDITSPNFPS